MDYQGSQNQGADNSMGSAAEYEPSEQEKELCKTIHKMFEAAKKAREPYCSRWADYYKMYRGIQWKEKRPSYRHSSVVNLIFTAINNQVPLLTDGRPRVEYLAKNPQDTEIDDIMNSLFQSDWERFDWTTTLLEDLYDSATFGTALAALDFDDSADYGLGAIRWNSLEPMYSYPQGGASDINSRKRCRYFIYAEPVSLEEVRARYPEKGCYVKADMRDLWQSDKTDLQDSRFRSPTHNDPTQDFKSGSNSDQSAQAMVMTLFWRPTETEEVQTTKKNEDGSEEPIYELRLKYPKGRKIVRAGNIILEDDALDLDDTSIPVQKMVNYIDPRSFWGISDVEQTEGPQQIFNKMISFCLDVMVLMGNPIWVVSNDSGVNTDELYNMPGAVVEKEPGSEVRREEGVQLQPYILSMIDRVKAWFDDISGSQEVSRGVNPSGVTAAAAIEDLQQSGRTRIRQKARNMDSFLKEMGRQYAQIALKNYTVPKVRRTTGKDGSEKYFKFHTSHIEDEQGNKRTQINYTEMGRDKNTGKMMEIASKQHVLVGDFDVIATTQSGLPFAKNESEQKLFALYDRQAIDVEELLRGIEYPNVDKVLQRRAEQQQMQAQQQQQQRAPAA